MVINHEDYACLFCIRFFFEPFALGYEESDGVLNGFASAFVAHFGGDVIEVFEQFRWKCNTYPGDFCHCYRLGFGRFMPKSFYTVSNTNFLDGVTGGMKCTSPTDS